MSTAGKYLRSNYSVLYNGLIFAINKVILLFQPYSIYITDNLGGSFKSYLKSNDKSQKINELKKNLDQESIALIDTLLERFLHYPDANNKRRISKNDKIAGGLLLIETQAQQKVISDQLIRLKNSVVLQDRVLEESVFYFYHGLTLLPSEIKNYIANQHFIDIGAYVGDSAIALNKFQYSKIYSLEISQKSIDVYKYNLSQNKIPQEKYEVLNIGVAAGDNETPITIFDTGSAGLSSYRKEGKYDEIEVVRKSLDWIVNQNSIQPKFIKVDIEGAAMDFVRGASQTLTKHRPVLSIAIYHNPIEFFEVKPVLEKLLDNYTFLVRKLNSGIKNNLIHSEVILLAYPNEVTNK